MDNIVDKKVEDLLKPRYKVIADYPGNDTPVGTIHDNEFTVRFHEKTLNSYPHLFKKLEWWEERKESEMPEYVKSKNADKNFYYKIIKWDMVGYITGYITETQVCNLSIWKPEFNYYPCTESEYLNQKNN
jgi:hypothetical protein